MSPLRCDYNGGNVEALDIASLRRHAPAGDIAAFSVTQDAVLTIWNVVVGGAVMLWAFRYGQVTEVLAGTRRPRRVA
jgi:hypothetical protein